MTTITNRSDGTGRKPLDARDLLLTCSVCLRQHAGTSKERLVRHGFSVVGTGHGQGHLGAWHTGPCWGADYPHLGLSTEGTERALERVRAALGLAAKRALELDAEPPLPWSRTIREYKSEGYGSGRRTERAETREVKPGDQRTYLPDHGHTIPSYEDLLRETRQKLEYHREELRRSEAEYVRVIGTWTAERYKPVPRPGKVAIIHLAAAWARGSRSKESRVTVGYCQRYAMHPSLRVAHTTTDREAVTCSRCQKQMGPAKPEEREVTP